MVVGYCTADVLIRVVRAPNRVIRPLLAKKRIQIALTVVGLAVAAVGVVVIVLPGGYRL